MKQSNSDRAAALLEFEQVSKWYGPVIGVNQVSFSLEGGITGLVGANGAGKSTLLRLATGQLRPNIGSVRVWGRDAWSWQSKAVIGYCPDTDVCYDEMSGFRFVDSMARLCGYRRPEARERAKLAIERVGMTASAHRTIGGYSKGMRQRIKLASSLIHDPQLIVLDEPLSGIDPVGRRELIELFKSLAEQGKCLLVSSHELEAIEKLTDHVAVMARGRVAAVGTLMQIRDLFEDMPLSVRIDCDRARELASRLLLDDSVAGVDTADGTTIIVRAANPRRFFRGLTQLVANEHLSIHHLQPLDESAHAILGYLLGGSGRT